MGDYPSSWQFLLRVRLAIQTPVPKILTSDDLYAAAFETLEPEVCLILFFCFAERADP